MKVRTKWKNLDEKLNVGITSTFCSRKFNFNNPISAIWFGL